MVGLFENLVKTFDISFSLFTSVVSWCSLKLWTWRLWILACFLKRNIVDNFNLQIFEFVASVMKVHVYGKKGNSFPLIRHYFAYNWGLFNKSSEIQLLKCSCGLWSISSSSGRDYVLYQRWKVCHNCNWKCFYGAKILFRPVNQMCREILYNFFLSGEKCSVSLLAIFRESATEIRIVLVRNHLEKKVTIKHRAV